jgi:hypothetical protein
MEVTSINSNNKLILGLLSAVSILLIVRYFHNKSQTNSQSILDGINESETEKIAPTKSIVIGDSQSVFISNNNSIAKIIGTEQTEKNLWKSGIDLNWLKKAVEKYPVSENVKNVVLSIGANGSYSPKENIAGLLSSLKITFPNAKFYIVKGSWGWGNIKSVTESRVNTYYDIFKKLGAVVIPTPIGKTTNPHTNLPVYKVIGKEINEVIK